MNETEDGAVAAKVVNATDDVEEQVHEMIEV